VVKYGSATGADSSPPVSEFLDLLQCAEVPRVIWCPDWELSSIRDGLEESSVLRILNNTVNITVNITGTVGIQG
jgi:hypothetical protein